MRPSQEAAVVITPTIGTPELLHAIKSVQAQTYPDVHHLVVIDGAEYEEKTREVLKGQDLTNVTIMVLPYNTGHDYYFGHRIFAGLSQLLNHPYVLLLDEDNTYSSTHVESLIKVMAAKNLDWAYSLRTLMDFDGTPLVDDNSISTGVHSVPGTAIRQGIDTSCYAFRRRFLVRVGHNWHGKGAADWNFFYAVKDSSRFECSNQHTVFYRLKEDPAIRQRVLNWVTEGNKLAYEHYGTPLPWEA